MSDRPAARAWPRASLRRASIVDVLLLAVAVAWGSTYWVAKELVSPDTVLETVVGKRKLSRLFYLAAVIAVAGVYFLATGGATASFGFGDLLILLAAVARAVHVRGCTGSRQDAASIH